MNGGNQLVEGLFIVCALAWTIGARLLLPWPWNLISVIAVWTTGAAQIQSISRG